MFVSKLILELESMFREKGHDLRWPVFVILDASTFMVPTWRQHLGCEVEGPFQTKPHISLQIKLEMNW